MIRDIVIGVAITFVFAIPPVLIIAVAVSYFAKDVSNDQE